MLFEEGGSDAERLLSREPIWQDRQEQIEFWRCSWGSLSRLLRRLSRPEGFTPEEFKLITHGADRGFADR